MMKKHRLFTSAIVICLCVCLFTACSNNASLNGGNGTGNGGNQDCTHSSTEWKIDKEATCTADGSKHEECSNCGETLSTESIPSLGHDYDETIIPPTEEQQGYTLHQCSRCNDNYKDNFVDYEYTEAEYKQMFETEILTAIQKEYNEYMPAEQLHLKNVELVLINYATGEISFTCTQNSIEVYVETVSEEVTKHQTFKAQYENFQMDGFECKIYTRQTNEELAEEIVEFALTQPELQEYIEQNNLDLSNYKILNVEKFSGDVETFNRVTKITLILEDKIFSFEVGGPTGYHSTEEGSYEALQNVSKVSVSDITIKPYADLDVES